MNEMGREEMIGNRWIELEYWEGMRMDHRIGMGKRRRV
jgi:hypothetical protein